MEQGGVWRQFAGERSLARGIWLAAAVALLAVTGRARAEISREALIPAGATTLLRVQAEGVQIYECAASAADGAAWRFREPLATLIADGKTVGRHFAGPAWALNDGSGVTGRVVEQAPGESPRDIPWLRLEVVRHSGAGVLAAATGVVRMETRGGVFAGACDAVGSFHLEPYSAVYVLLRG